MFWRGASNLVRIVRAPVERPEWSRFDQFGLRVFSEVVNEEEEAAIVAELASRLRKLDYLPSHWDGVITGYREFQLGTQSDEESRHPRTTSIVSRLKQRYFRHLSQMNEALHPSEWPDVEEPALGAHVLDYKPTGFVRPHIDSVEFAGPLLTGLSLISPVVMRFVMKPPNEHASEQSCVVDAIIPPRSIYYMSLASRYECTHETFAPEDDTFVKMYGLPEERGRRISIILRSPPETINPLP